MKTIKKLDIPSKLSQFPLLIEKINELVDAFNQREHINATTQGKEPETIDERVVVGNIFRMHIDSTDKILVIQSLMSYGYHWERFDKKEAQELLSKITNLVESMD